MKHLYLAILAAAAALTASADGVSPSYYSSLDGISDPQQLKTAVWTLCSPHTHPQSDSAYGTYYSALPSKFEITDVVPAGEPYAGCIWDMYSDIRVTEWSGGLFNREHCFPKSWWGGSKTIPAYVDLYHLYPSNAKANSAKSNYPLGVVDMSLSVYYDNGVSKVGYPSSGQGGGAKYVYEPADEYKGDFARTYFYMVTIYQDLTWATNYMFMLQQNLWPTLKPWGSQMLLEWAANDKVSQKELDRIEAVYGIQNNRNPFIDMPELAQYIWGSKQGQKFVVTDNLVDWGSDDPVGKEPVLYSPVDGSALDFGQVASGDNVIRSLLFSGENLSGDVSVIVTGDNRKLFTVETQTIPASRINAVGGTYLAITYKPDALGEHTAQLTVYDVTGWPAGKSINVELRGTCLPVPELNQLTALAPSNVTANGYTANWTAATEVVDYYVVTRTVTLNGETTTQTLEAETNSLDISDYNPESTECYSVQSVRLNHYSPMSNTVYVAYGALESAFAQQPDNAILTAAAYGDGQLVVTLTGTHTGLRIIDAAGRVVTAVTRPSRCEEFVLQPGIYFVITDNRRSPIRVAVR